MENMKLYPNFLDVPHKAYRVSQLNAASRTPVAQLFVYLSNTSKTQVGAAGDELQSADNIKCSIYPILFNLV